MALDLLKNVLFALVRALSQKVLIWSSPNFMKMSKTMISWSSSIITQIAPGTLELRPLSYPKNSVFSLVQALSQKILIGSSPNSMKMSKPIISWSSSITSQIISGTLELRPLIYWKTAFFSLVRTLNKKTSIRSSLHELYESVKVCGQTQPPCAILIGTSKLLPHSSLKCQLWGTTRLVLVVLN